MIVSALVHWNLPFSFCQLVQLHWNVFESWLHIMIAEIFSFFRVLESLDSLDYESSVVTFLRTKRAFKMK